MYRNLFALVRISIGLAILMLGIIGIFLPILQGWLLILVAIPIISPAHGKKAVAWLKVKIPKLKNALHRRYTNRQS